MRVAKPTDPILAVLAQPADAAPSPSFELTPHP